mmetsp:Transcript_29844/g.80212  ORF Transcript_29844/g.80212 Transcript_29844/m.80212 type:complete len:228 (-) Transcript_29844:441-1124(-)
MSGGRAPAFLLKVEEEVTAAAAVSTQGAREEQPFNLGAAPLPAPPPRAGKSAAVGGRAAAVPAAATAAALPAGEAAGRAAAVALHPEVAPAPPGSSPAPQDEASPPREGKCSFEAMLTRAAGPRSAPLVTAGEALPHVLDAVRGMPARAAATAAAACSESTGKCNSSDRREGSTDRAASTAARSAAAEASASDLPPAAPPPAKSELSTSVAAAWRLATWFSRVGFLP